MGALTGPFIAPLFTGLDRPQGLGHVFAAVDIAAFADVAEFKRRVEDSIRAVRALPPVGGADLVYLPGEPEWLREQEARTGGIVLDPIAARGLEDLERQ